MRTGRGPAPRGRPHRKLEPINVTSSSSQAKKSVARAEGGGDGPGPSPCGASKRPLFVKEM